MHAKAVRKVLVAVIALIFLGSMFACAGREFAPKDPYPYWYYPKELTEADRAIEAARQQGKDKECPKEFEEAKARVDRAYEEYVACKTPGPIPINIVCPKPPPKCDLTANKKEIVIGEQDESVTLTLTTAGKVTSAVLDGTEVAPTGGTKTISEPLPKYYDAKVVGPGGSNTCSVPVSIRLRLLVHFPFDRPKVGDDVAKWFETSDADNPEDPLDPSHREKMNTQFMNKELKDNLTELKKAVDFVSKYHGTRFTVTGHTDSKERKPGYNQALSERRANAVRAYIDQQVNAREKIKAKGLGAKEPIAKETTADGKDIPEGRAKNRRVEITSEPISPR